jgi:hypothetical protein
MILAEIKTLKQAEGIAHTLSKTSKMPCLSWSIPASRCNVGSKLAQVEGSTCSNCYACKGSYAWSTTQEALEKRYHAIFNPQWVEAMAKLISARSRDYFRWFDSGDIQGLVHLEKIVAVCNLTPETRHWLPTREFGVVREYLKKYGEFPDNLTVRLSAHFVDKPIPSMGETLDTLPKSTVSTSEPPKGAVRCPSGSQGNKCLDCRHCWDKTVNCVDYKAH